MLDAIVLAGGGTIKDSDYSENKALVCIHGKTMVEYVVEALLKSHNIARILLIGPKEKLAEIFTGTKIEIIEAANTIMDNIISGINYLGSNRNILVCTSDIPLVTTQSIDDFISRSLSMNLDLSYPIVEKSLSEKYFPEMKRTYTKLKEGIFTGGNVFYLNPRIINKGLAIARELIEARKRPLKMARIVSFKLLIQLMTGTLTIEKIEKRFSKMLNARASAIISEYPELANDVDKMSDLLAAKKHLAKRIN